MPLSSSTLDAGLLYCAKPNSRIETNRHILAGSLCIRRSLAQWKMHWLHIHVHIAIHSSPYPSRRSLPNRYTLSQVVRTIAPKARHPCHSAIFATPRSLNQRAFTIFTKESIPNYTRTYGAITIILSRVSRVPLNQDALSATFLTKRFLLMPRKPCLGCPRKLTAVSFYGRPFGMIGLYRS